MAANSDRTPVRPSLCLALSWTEQSSENHSQYLFLTTTYIVSLKTNIQAYRSTKVSCPPSSRLDGSTLSRSLLNIHLTINRSRSARAIEIKSKQKSLGNCLKYAPRFLGLDFDSQPTIEIGRRGARKQRERWGPRVTSGRVGTAPSSPRRARTPAEEILQIRTDGCLFCPSRGCWCSCSRPLALPELTLDPH